MANKLSRSTPENLEVLFEDNHLIAVNKRVGDITQGDKTGDLPLSEVVKEYIKRKYNKPGEVFLGVVHRIDRPTSGVVLFARTSKALTRLNEMFKKRAVQKTYWAVVKKAPPKSSDRLEDWLYKVQKKNKSFVGDKSRSDAKRGVLTYELIGSSNDYHLLQVTPETGRHHQIRAQLAHIGCPIKGDLKYGFDRSNPDGGIHLHARQLEFTHPVRKTNLKITAPVPDDVLWKFFEAQQQGA